MVRIILLKMKNEYMIIPQALEAVGPRQRLQAAAERVFFCPGQGWGR